MKRIINRLPNPLWLSAGTVAFALAVMVLGALFVFLPEDDRASWGSCISETFGEISNVAGFDFQFVDTACDLLAKSEAISIFVSRRSGSSDQVGRTEIFKYDGPMEPPTITEIDPRTIRISVGAISSIYFAKEQWDGIAILYDIGHIDYPGRNDPPRR
ncbi:MAG: hypothetical protein JSR91_01815 [Proteobacteria bacterium]|nr:hypothetical protein [Pseudomonadota bacterium]